MIAGYADIRWHQTADIGYTPNNFMQNVFMAVAFDLTDKMYDHFHDFRFSVCGKIFVSNCCEKVRWHIAATNLNQRRSSASLLIEYLKNCR